MRSTRPSCGSPATHGRSLSCGIAPPVRSTSSVGDARLRLVAAAGESADLIVLDAFSSDAIPTHLLTREAVRLYRAKLAGGGLIAMHLSNRSIDLDPVVGQLARDAGLFARVRHDRKLSPQERRDGKSTSIWAVLAVQPSHLGALAADPAGTAAARTR